LTADRVVALDRLTHTFALMIQSEPIASAAIERLRINRSPASVAAATSAATPENTNLLYVMVKDEDPTVAQRLSNALADSFAEAVQQFEPSRTGEGAVPTVPVTVFEHARLPAVPDPSSLATNMAIAVTLGLGLAVAGILLADHLDVTVKGMSDIERRLKLTVLGVVPLYDEAVAAQVVRGRWTTTGQSA
jgi:non-specific protein-tyrosine kinase